MEPSNHPDSSRIAIAMVLVGLVMFGASLNDPFHFDDVLILKDSNVTKAAQWYHFFNPLHLRQLTFFTFYLNYLVGGDSPAGFHVVNVALHIANAILLFYLLQRFCDRWTSTVAAAVFLIHPIQVEPAVYVYQRSILLACFFSLLGLIAVTKKRPGWAAVFFFCAVESKESALAVPLVLVAFSDQLKFRTESLRALTDRRYRIAVVVVVALLGGAALGLLVYWGEQTVGIGAISRMSPLSYFLIQTRVIYTYLRLLIFPYPQSLEYELTAGVPVLQIFGLLLLIGGSWWISRRSRWRIYGLCALAFFILLAPTSSIIPSTDVAYEHRLYLPMLAFCLLMALALSHMPSRTVVAGVVLSVFGFLTIQREQVWSSETALWEDTARHAPGKARVWFNLGGAYLNVDNAKASDAFKRAVELQPHFPEALYDLGVIEQSKGNLGGAFGYYERAVQQAPDFWPAWNNMGNAAFALGNRDRALEYLENTLRLNRDYWPAQYNVAIVLYSTGRYEQAARRLKTVLDWRPDLREARYLFAVTLESAGHRSAASEQWKKLGESGTAQAKAPAMVLAPSRP